MPCVMCVRCDYIAPPEGSIADQWRDVKKHEAEVHVKGGSGE